MANNTNATNCTIRSVLYLTIELDDREDILTIEKQITCQIFRSSQKPEGKPVRRSKQNDTKNRRFSKTALKKNVNTVANVYTRQTLAVDFRKLYFFTPSFLIVIF